MEITKIESKEIQMVDIEAIIPNPKNANRHSKEQIERLCKLIKYQGFRNPLIISNRTGFLAVGHGRLEAAHQLAMLQVPVIYQDFENEAQEYAYLISDNEIARWAELDVESVIEELNNIEIPELDILGVKHIETLKAPMFDPGDLDDQSQLDQLEPKMISCPNCGEEFDQRIHGN